MHEGKALKKLIFEREKPISWIAVKSAISRPQLYLMFEMDVIPEKYYPKLLKAGIDVMTIKNKAAKTLMDLQMEVILYQSKFEEQKTKNEKLQDTIIYLTSQLNKKLK